MLQVHSPDLTIQAERLFDGRRQQEQFGGGDNIVIVPATLQHQANWNQESPFALLFLEPDYLVEIAHESITADRVKLIPHHAMPDPLIDQIGRSLISELEFNPLGSRLFAGSLAIALSIQLLRYYSGEVLSRLAATFTSGYRSATATEVATSYRLYQRPFGKRFIHCCDRW